MFYNCNGNTGIKENLLVRIVIKRMMALKKNGIHYFIYYLCHTLWSLMEIEIFVVVND